MMGKVGANLLAGFQGVRENQELISLRAQVQELQAALAQARAGELDEPEKADLDQRMEGLTAVLQETGGVHEIALDLIDRDDAQPRTVFPRVTIQERMESLRYHGQKTPIIVIPLEDGRYRLFDGELRFRSAQKLQWPKLKAVFLPEEEVTDARELFEGQVITSIHSQRLHDLDLATALVRLAVEQHPTLAGQEERFGTLLNTALRRLEREGKLSELAEIRLANPDRQTQWIEEAGFREFEEQQLFATILRLQLNPVSINSNVFPLLKLAEDLKEVIRTEGLESSKARELNRLSAEKLNQTEEKARQIRQQVTQDVIQNRLSLNETRKLVQQMIQAHNPQVRSAPSNDRWVKSVAAIEVDSIADAAILKELKAALKAKLDEVSQALRK
ncbi:MAG: hypothetical protein B0A82_26400 [Alkalinema sp. CACIAM 70d]|nr:MAG: hypothetical protein B0A82_26400 [Alkalinema sp. CACIAM 70d]